MVAFATRVTEPLVTVTMCCMNDLDLLTCLHGSQSTTVSIASARRSSRVVPRGILNNSGSPGSQQQECTTATRTTTQDSWEACGPVDDMADEEPLLRALADEAGGSGGKSESGLPVPLDTLRRLLNYLRRLEQGYNPSVVYHNATHAADAVHGVYYFLTKYVLIKIIYPSAPVPLYPSTPVPLFLSTLTSFHSHCTFRPQGPCSPACVSVA